METSQLSRGFPLRKGQELGVLGGYPHVSGGLLFKPSILGGQLGAVILLCEEDPKAPKPDGNGCGDGFDDGARGENCWRSVLLKPFVFLRKRES